MKKRCSLLIAGILVFIIGACAPAVPASPEATTPVQPTLTASPMRMSSPSDEPLPSETPTSLATPMISCETHSASVVLAASPENLKVGDKVTVSVTLNNSGCAALGLPQYRLTVQSDGPGSILAPENPEPMIHYLAVAPDQSDKAEFDLLAVADGQAIFTASVSFEVHLGYPGPAYWGSSSGESLLITVAP